MPTSSKRTNQPLRCPHCGDGVIAPNRIVSADSVSLFLVMRCEGCDHEFVAVAADSPVVFSRKSDRRIN